MPEQSTSEGDDAMKRMAVAAAAGALALTMITPTQAAVAAAGKAAVKPTAEVISVSKVYLVNGTPMVAGTYKCTGRLSHLWVSAKQGKGDLTKEGSGAKARSWYQRTYDNVVDCDGQRHSRLFKMAPTGDTGRVRPARRAYVQFCLLTANSRGGFEEGGNSSFASNMKYRNVQVLPG
jgi:hypothetical protein